MVHTWLCKSLQCTLEYSNLGACYRIHFNFCVVKLSQIAGFCNFCVFIFANHEFLRLLLSHSLCHWGENPSQFWDIPPFGDQKRTNGHPQVADQHMDAKNDPVTAHTWPYKRFLSSSHIRSSGVAWHQWRSIVCTGINSCTCMVSIRKGYRENVANFCNLWCHS